MYNVINNIIDDSYEKLLFDNMPITIGADSRVLVYYNFDTIKKCRFRKKMILIIKEVIYYV
jgi:hypothetical protein